MEEQNRLNEAYKYVSIASETYSVVYGDASDNTIIAQWLKLQIAYSQSKPKSQVVDMADQLFNSLVQRDQEMIRKNNMLDSYDGIEDELKGEMEKIKVLCIATHIMEMTRMLPEEKKRALQRFCDEIQLKKFEQDKKQNEVFLKKQMEYYSKNIDLYSVKKVSNVQFSQNDEDFLKSLYKWTKKEGGFRDFYEKMLNDALTQQKQKTDRKFQQNNEKK